MSKVIIALLFCLLLYLPLGAMNVSTYLDTIKTELDTIEVGDRIYFNVDITHDATSSVRYVPQESSEIFIILDFREKNEQHNDELLTSYQFVSAFFDTGDHTIPPQEFILSSSNDSITVYSDSLRVYIQSVLPQDSTELKDIKPPVGLHLGFWDIFFPVLIILIIIAAIVFVTRRKKGLPILPEKKKPILPAHVIALKKIDHLKLQDYLSKGDIKRYYVEVSWICREYLENRYHKQFLEMTNFEIRKALKILDVECRAEILSILRECDKVKFAKFVPPLQDANSILDKLIDIIHKTKEQEVEQTDEN